MFITYYNLDGRQIWRSSVSDFNPETCADEVSELLAKSSAKLGSYLIGQSRFEHPFLGVFLMGPLSGLVVISNDREPLSSTEVWTAWQLCHTTGEPYVDGSEDDGEHHYEGDEL